MSELDTPSFLEYTTDEFTSVSDVTDDAFKKVKKILNGQREQRGHEL